MPMKDALLPEYDHEMGTTRRVLERVPEADLAWRPHEKSFTLGQLAAHVANIPKWVVAIADNAIFDLSSIGDDARPAQPTSRQELLTRFDGNVKQARRKLDEMTDAAMLGMWTLKQGPHEVFTMPKISVLRTFVMNHQIHHRGQLTVYLRLRNVPLPSVYSPTADEP
jgi:uncharacterized damage-inducible protein DinB